MINRYMPGDKVRLTQAYLGWGTLRMGDIVPAGTVSPDGSTVLRPLDSNALSDIREVSLRGGELLWH